jgi:FMN phosphatase YigB (HAD superfamily)
MSNIKYKTIFFDWNKTLSNSLFWDQLADPKHERHNWHKNIINFVFAENKGLINDWMLAKIDEKYIAKIISERFGYSKETVLKDLAESCEKMKIVNEEVLEIIAKLRKKGIKCVIATDNMDTFLKYTRPAMNLDKHFDDFLVSFDQKILKFDVRNNSVPFFDDYLKNNNLLYQDVLLIDDCIDKSGTYEKLGFEILQIFSPEDFVNKLKTLEAHKGKIWLESDGEGRGSKFIIELPIEE